MTDKKLTDADEKWIGTQEELMERGQKLVQQASDEALDYLGDAVQNITDRQWRKMAMETQALEMGAGIALAEHVVPQIYQDMEKKLRKRLKVTKNVEQSLRHIYIGRVIKNVRKELQNEYEKQS